MYVTQLLNPLKELYGDMAPSKAALNVTNRDNIQEWTGKWPVLSVPHK